MSEEVIRIAQRIRETREATGRTPAEVAEAIGVVVDQYLRFEEGDEDMPIGFLTQFADFFDIPLTSLLSGEEPKLNQYYVTRAGKGLHVERHPGYDFQALAHRFMSKKCEPFFVVVEPENTAPSFNAHVGQEFDYVLKGTVKFTIGDQEIILHEGDSIYLDSAYMHAIEAAEDEPATFLAIVMQ